MKRRTLMAGAAVLMTLTAATAAMAADKPVKVGLVAKSLGNGFFDAANKGANEAAKDLGNVEIIYTGPTTTTAEGQIEVLNALIAQRVDVIAISANDPDAVAPTLKKAQARGIKVMSFDSGVAQDARTVHLAPSSDALIGEACLNLVSDAIGGSGKIAILSATPTSTNQNAWIAVMKKDLTEDRFKGLDLVTIAYGDDLADKSYRETQALLKQHPDIKGIISPTTIGIVAGAKAIEDQGLSGKVWMTGLGLPSELAGHVKAGTVKSFAIWNPIDLGYSTAEIAVQMVRTPDAVGPGKTVKVGRVGEITFDDKGVGAMAKPFTYDKSNVDEFAKIF